MKPENTEETQTLRPPNEAPEGPDAGERTDHVRKVLSDEQIQQMPPEKKKQLEMTNNMLTDMLYNPKTKNETAAMIKSAPPEQSIPATVNTIFMKFEDMLKDKKGPLPLDIKLGAGVHLFSEVMELSEAVGALPEDVGPEVMEPLLKETMQQYIQRGLKDKSIDPIELQQQVEPLLTDEERGLGMEMAQMSNTPGQLGQGQVDMAMQDKAQAPLKLQNAQLQKQNKSMQGALKGIAEQPPQEA